jgi:hypothetical protein
VALLKRQVQSLEAENGKLRDKDMRISFSKSMPVDCDNDSPGNSPCDVYVQDEFPSTPLNYTHQSEEFDRIEATQIS